MAKSSYKYFNGPTYDLSASNKTSFTLGASHVFSANLINEAKLNFGTEIKGGFASSIKFGYEIEFKHPLTTKYEIDLEAEHVKDTKANASNFYNATQFRATAGELAAKPFNQVNAVLTSRAKKVAYFALVLQLAATSLTMTTAVIATQDADDKNPDVPFWGGTGGKYWGSWSTALIDGLSLVSLAAAFVAGRMIDGNKRKKPERHKNFLNMDHNTGIMMGVQSSNKGTFDNGSWYRQDSTSIDIGFNAEMEFNDSLTMVDISPAMTNLSARVFLDSHGVLLNGGTGSIKNLVPKGEKFQILLGDVLTPRIELDEANSNLLLPSAVGANYGLTMQSNNVKLSLDADTDLDLGTNSMAKLRKGNSSFALTSNDATLSATTINLAATAVHINGVDFKTGLVTMGDLQAVITDVSALGIRTEEIADSTARTVASVADDAAKTAAGLADQVADVAQQVQLELARMTVEFESQTEYLLNQIRRLRR
jgi:hypothetical protein